MINVSLEKWGTIPKAFSVTPNISYEQAYTKVANHAGFPLMNGETCKPQLMILTLAKGRLFERRNLLRQAQMEVGNGYRYFLVWKVCPRLEGQKQERLEALVDAKTGNKVYSYQDSNDYFQARANVFPRSNDGILPDGVLGFDW